MLDPAFDWVKFKRLANDIQRIPSTVEDLKKSELEGLLYYVEHHRREHIVKANDLAMENNCSIDSFLFDPTFEALEVTVKNELARRDAPAKMEMGKPKKLPQEEKTLPPLEDVYNGNVLDLWPKLAKMEKPLVSMSGKFIWEGENVSILMALSQALVTTDLITGGHKAEIVYRILCRHWNIKEAKRPRITGKAGSSARYTDFLTYFHDILKE